MVCVIVVSGTKVSCGNGNRDGRSHVARLVARRIGSGRNGMRSRFAQRGHHKVITTTVAVERVGGSVFRLEVGIAIQAKPDGTYRPLIFGTHAELFARLRQVNDGIVDQWTNVSVRFRIDECKAGNATKDGCRSWWRGSCSG